MEFAGMMKDNKNKVNIKHAHYKLGHYKKEATHKIAKQMEEKLESESMNPCKSSTTDQEKQKSVQQVSKRKIVDDAKRSIIDIVECEIKITATENVPEMIKGTVVNEPRPIEINDVKAMRCEQWKSNPKHTFTKHLQT
jgi:hypothetical protein